MNFGRKRGHGFEILLALLKNELNSCFLFWSLNHPLSCSLFGTEPPCACSRGFRRWDCERCVLVSLWPGRANAISCLSAWWSSLSIIQVSFIRVTFDSIDRFAKLEKWNGRKIWIWRKIETAQRPQKLGNNSLANFFKELFWLLKKRASLLSVSADTKINKS